MREEKRYIFSEEDYKLLKKPIPVSPCRDCGCGILNKSTCSGCDKYTKYQREIKPFEDNNLVNIAVLLKRYYTIQREINQLNIEICQVLTDLPDEVIDNVIKKK